MSQENMQGKNTVCWADIPAINLERAVKFYTAVLGTTVQRVQENGFEFGLLPHENDNVSGCLSTEGKPSMDGPLVYLDVGTAQKINLAIKAVEENGGKILMQPMQMGPYGTRAIIVDSEGNRIALYHK